MDISKTDNILYNIINFEEPQQIFFYFILLILFLFIFTNIDFSITLFIGIIFYSILIYYFYTNRNINNVDSAKKIKTKYETFSDTEDSVIKEYPDIIDFIFYLSTFKEYNIDTFNEIINLFDNFIFLYNSILIDKSLSSTLFKSITLIKYSIINKIESFNLNTDNIILTEQIKKNRIKAEELLNKYLDNVLLIHKKNLYYNGYNNNTKIITSSNIIECNLFDTDKEFNRNRTIYDFSEFI
jgi:hypothetical protein